MKVGDLVKYGPWYNSYPKCGLVVEGDAPYFFVLWNEGEPEWEDECELETINESN